MTQGAMLDWVSDKDKDGIRHILLEGKRSGRQPTVFIIGALRHKNKIQQELNILMARKLARKYWEDGWAVICPHLNGGAFDGDLDDHRIMAGHLVLLCKCDLAAVVKNKWLDESTGSKGEIEMADTAGVPIVWEEVRL